LPPQKICATVGVMAVVGVAMIGVTAVVGVAAGGWGVGVDVLPLQAASSPTNSNTVQNVVFLFIILMFLFKMMNAVNH
jgi:hypothetical protein